MNELLTDDRYVHPIEVKDTDIDRQGHVNNVVYVRWVQDAAVAHWKYIIDADLKALVDWVVFRHEIDYKKPVYRNDQIVIRTWIEEVTPVTTERFCEILRGNDLELVAKARTVWCSIDLKSGRPKRIDPRVKEAFYRQRGNIPK
jgi:acyl-CoA thioester hydrolase